MCGVDWCSQKFSNSVDLNRHRKTAHTEGEAGSYRRRRAGSRKRYNEDEEGEEFEEPEEEEEEEREEADEAEPKKGSEDESFRSEDEEEFLRSTRRRVRGARF